jgi:hypothetical protein
VAFVWLLAWPSSSPAQPNIRYAGVSDPFLFLLREPAVYDDLRLSASQRQALSAVNDRFDGPLLALRTRPADKANPQMSQILADTRSEAEAILSRSQQQRLAEIALRVRGIGCLQDDQVAERLQLRDDQRRGIDRILSDTQQETAKLHEQAQGGGDRESLEAEHLRLQEQQQKAILALLAPPQKERLIGLLGPSFDTSRLGRASFKAPELVESHGWINSQPLRIAGLRGQLIALHFWTYG